MHRVKGLEFTTVFIVAANKNYVPLKSAVNRIDPAEREAAITSERCLLYVAMTRAKKKIMISAYGMDLNVKGVFNATKAASECMIAKGQGVILSTSSMVSIYGQPSGFAYPASKFAVNGLTVSLARKLGPKGIRVNAVAPGITLTDMMKAVPKEVIDPLIKQIPLRRLGQPEDIANAFVFLASDEASYITGVVLSVDGMART